MNRHLTVYFKDAEKGVLEIKSGGIQTCSSCRVASV